MLYICCTIYDTNSQFETFCEMNFHETQISHRECWGSIIEIKTDQIVLENDKMRVRKRDRERGCCIGGKNMINDTCACKKAPSKIFKIVFFFVVFFYSKLIILEFPELLLLPLHGRLLSSLAVLSGAFPGAFSSFPGRWRALSGSFGRCRLFLQPLSVQELLAVRLARNIDLLAKFVQRGLENKQAELERFHDGTGSFLYHIFVSE